MKILEQTHNRDSHRNFWFSLGFFGGTGVWIKGFALANQGLYHLRHISSPKWDWKLIGQGRVAMYCFICTGFYVWMKGTYISLVCINSTLTKSYSVRQWKLRLPMRGDTWANNINGWRYHTHGYPFSIHVQIKCPFLMVSEPDASWNLYEIPHWTFAKSTENNLVIQSW
jgi:hypothetical protein